MEGGNASRAVIERLPLKQEKVQLTERKQAQYESYSALRSQWLELSKLARNRDSIAGQAMLSERSSKKRTI